MRFWAGRGESSYDRQGGSVVEEAADHCRGNIALSQTLDYRRWRGKCHHTKPEGYCRHGEVKINLDVPSLHFSPGGLLDDMNGPYKALPERGSVGLSGRQGSTLVGKGKMGPPERVGYLKDDLRFVTSPDCSHKTRTLTQASVLHTDIASRPIVQARAAFAPPRFF